MRRLLTGLVAALLAVAALGQNTLVNRGNLAPNHANGALAFSTADVNAPTLSLPLAGTPTTDGSTGAGVTTNEGNGTLYWAVVTNGGSCTDAQLKAGAGGNIVAGVASNQAVTVAGAQSIAAITGLTSSTTYQIKYLQRDAAGNDSTQASVDLTTSAPSYMAATGGTITTDGDYKVHSFTSSGTFTVTSVGTEPTYGNKVWYLVIAGGGGGGRGGGGGGAGGYLTNAAYDHTITAQAYSITVGAGGAGAPGSTGYNGTSGSNSVFDTVTATGGGYGGGNDGGGTNIGVGANGGSGGGGAADSAQQRLGGTATQGFAGGANRTGAGTSTSPFSSGGGGGSAAIGTDGNSSNTSGNGGNGTSSSITGSAVTRAGGGGGADYVASGTPGTGGTGGGGAGVHGAQGTDATANTGSGGGGTSSNGGATRGGNGGSGVVILRYKFQYIGDEQAANEDRFIANIGANDPHWLMQAGMQ